MIHFDFVVTTLLNGIWQGIFVAAIAWLLLKLLPRLNPTTRFTVLWVTFIAVVMLPFAPIAWRLLSPRGPMDSSGVEATGKFAAATAAPAPVQEPRFSRQDSPTAPRSHHAAIPTSAAPSLSERGDEASTPLTGVSRSVSMMAAVEHPVIRVSSWKIPGMIGTLWAFLSLLMLVRLAVGLRRLEELKAEAVPPGPEWQLQLSILSRMNGVGRRIQLLVSPRISAPMSLGFLHPAILIPQTLVDTLSNTELEHVVLHELAHLRRRDDWTNLAQKLIAAVLPIQPALCWIGYRMSIEREMACDDWVIAATGTAKPYAASLTKVAELTQWRRADILAAGATGNRSQLFTRVHNMLNETRNAAPKLAPAPVVAAIAAAGALICVGARAPQIIAFAQTTANVNSRQEPLPPISPRAPEASRAPNAALASAARLAAPARPAEIAALAPDEPLLSQPTAPAPLAPSPPRAAAAPLAPTAPADGQQSGETHVEITNRDGWNSLIVKIDGAVEFTDDDHDVKSLSPGGRFRIEERTGLSAQAYEVKADSAGNLTKTWLVGGSAKPMDADGRAWLERLMPQMIRESGMGAGPRVARFLRQGGPQAVLTETALIHSDGSKRIYLEQLFAQATLNTEQLKEAVGQIRKISSDGDKAQVLTDVDGKYFTSELRTYLFEAVESISSDGDKRRVLSDIVKKDAGNADTLVSTARAAKHIASDGDKAEVLIEMAGPYQPRGGLDVEYFEAAKSISSDGDHARVLSTMLAAHGDDRDTLERVLQSAEKISSDGDKARVLREAVPRYVDDDLIRKAFFDAANSVSSDGDHQQVLVALAHRAGVGAATLDGISKSAQRISSDGDKAHVLMELAGTNIEPVREDYFAAANTISSTGDHSEVLMTLLDKPGTSATMAIAAIQSATLISSDGDKGRVLLDAADRYPKDPGVEAALRKAVESVHSDGVYRSVMTEIERHRGNS